MDDYTLPPGEYLLPRPIARGYQLVPGVRLKDAAFSALGLALGAILWVGLHLFGVPFLFRGLASMLPVLLGGVLAIPIDDIHVWEFARDMREFAGKPKTLTYDWTRDDW